MDYTKAVGNVVELQCLAKFIEMGFDCSIPYGDACKYDFVADVQGEFLRIQCKSSTHPLKKDGSRDTQAIMFYCCAQTTNTKKTTRHIYTSDDIDYFATYHEGQVYLIPVEECSTSKTLRFSPPNNGQSNTWNKAEDYLIENILGHKQSAIFIQQSQEKKNLNKNIQYYCSQCEKNLVSKEGGLCHDCASFNSRKVERPDRETLKQMIRTTSFLELGRAFNVSDNAIRKWCKSENLPFKKSEISSYSEEEWSKI